MIFGGNVPDYCIFATKPCATCEINVD